MCGCPAGFPTNIAVALSNITIVGGAISNFIFNVGRRHAFYNRPLIDWNLILAMEPATILGALLGGYLNKVSSLLHGLMCPVLFLSWPGQTADDLTVLRAVFCPLSCPLCHLLALLLRQMCQEGCQSYIAADHDPIMCLIVYARRCRTG